MVCSLLPKTTPTGRAGHHSLKRRGIELDGGSWLGRAEMTPEQSSEATEFLGCEVFGLDGNYELAISCANFSKRFSETFCAVPSSWAKTEILNSSSSIR